MEHNNMEQINLGPTQEQLKTNANGKAVVLKHTHLNGPHTFVVTQEQARRIKKARRLNKGVNFKLNQEQIGMNPFLAELGTIVAGKLVSGAVKGIGKLMKGKGHIGKGHTPNHTPKKKTPNDSRAIGKSKKGSRKDDSKRRSPKNRADKRAWFDIEWDESRGLTNFEIQEIMYRNKLKNVLGIFSHDTLPQQTLNKGEALVINYNNQDEPSSHWICVFIGNEYPEAFDSFGVVPSKIIQEWLKKYTGSPFISYSSHQIQDKWSVMCGWYCIHYIMERTKGISQYDVIHNFEMNDTPANEKILKKYIE